MLKKIDRILIRVPQLPGAVKFYQEKLGLKLVREDARMASLRLEDDSVEIVLHVDPDLPAEGTYFLVDDVADMYRRRKELNLKFLSAPSRVSRGFTATVQDPFGTILQLIDHTFQSPLPAAPAAAGMLFADVEARSTPKRKTLVQLYEQIGRTADDLPYTPNFEQLYEPYAAAHAHPKPSRAEVWRHLLNLRKAGRLPKLGAAKSKPPPLDAEERARLKAVLAKDIGRRDRLPYTERFDRIVDSFNKTLARPLSPHLVWRAVATLAK